MSERRVIYIKALTAAQRRKSSVDERRLYLELGKLVRKWAVLQEQLAGIFQQATECPPHQANAMWHSLKSDLVQRQMLVAALKSAIDLHRPWKDDPKKQNKVRIFGEYVWAINEVTNFSHGRNDLIHSPITFYLASGATEFEAIVSDQYGNPRAEKLKNKELFQLCRWMNGFCEDMTKYVSSIWQHVIKHDELPKRPKFKLLSDFPTRRQPPKRVRRHGVKPSSKKR